jgi:ATP-dependent Clp protease, protease subunit
MWVEMSMKLSYHAPRQLFPILGITLAAIVFPSGGMSQQANPIKTTVIRFYSPVTNESVTKLLNVVDQRIMDGHRRIVLLISSQGGSVFDGLSAYHYLKGIPAEVVTHNFGEVDSIAAVLYCAGSKRYSVPQGRFLLHGISSTFAPIPFEEGLVEQQLKLMRQQGEGIASVIAATTNKPLSEVQAAIAKHTVLSADDAQKWGLVQEIREKLYNEGADVVRIGMSPNTSPDSEAGESRLTTNSLSVFTVPRTFLTISPYYGTTPTDPVAVPGVSPLQIIR